MKQTNSSIAQTYFEICCTLPLETEELWSWFCFEKGALGVETMTESPTELTLRIFFEHEPAGGAQKLVDDFAAKLLQRQKLTSLKKLTDLLKIGRQIGVNIFAR